VIRRNPWGIRAETASVRMVQFVIRIVSGIGFGDEEEFLYQPAFLKNRAFSGSAGYTTLFKIFCLQERAGVCGTCPPP
jgi:hypothetical protein